MSMKLMGCGAFRVPLWDTSDWDPTSDMDWNRTKQEVIWLSLVTINYKWKNRGEEEDGQ